MKNVDIKLSSEKQKNGTISATDLAHLCNSLVTIAQRVTYLNAFGIPHGSGKFTAWIEQACNIQVKNIGEGSTIIETETPAFNEVFDLPQVNFHLFEPELNEANSAIDIVIKALKDIKSGSSKSMFDDYGIYSAIGSLEPIYRNFDKLTFIDKNKKSNIELNKEEISAIKKMSLRQKKPKTIIVSGLLNQIKYIENQFSLRLDSGTKLNGYIDTDLLEVEKLNEFWGKESTIKGVLHFRPSGRPGSLKAQSIREFTEKDSFFRNPNFQPEIPFERTINQPEQIKKSPVAETFGKWPGDETEEEIDALLELLK